MQIAVSFFATPCQNLIPRKYVTCHTVTSLIMSHECVYVVYIAWLCAVKALLVDQFNKKARHLAVGILTTDDDENTEDLLITVFSEIIEKMLGWFF